MKRTTVAFSLIGVFILLVVGGDLWFSNSFAKQMNRRLDTVRDAGSTAEKVENVQKLDNYYQSQDFLAHRFIPTNRLEELEMLLHKLNAYLSVGDEHEVAATVAEIKARVNLLYSTDVYHWYHPVDYRIE